MSGKHTFRATIQETGGGGAFVSVPLDVEAVFGKKRVPVAATFDGEPYRGTLVRMGGPGHVLIVLKEIRERIGKGAGDEVEVMVREDTAPRVVEVPEALAEALRGDAGAAAAWERLSYTHRREYVRWIGEAKREQTRRDRIARVPAMLREGRKAR